jgi:hypothetical protein
MFGTKCAVYCSKQIVFMKMKKIALTALSLMFFAMANAQLKMPATNISSSATTMDLLMLKDAVATNSNEIAVSLDEMPPAADEVVAPVAPKSKYGPNLITVAPFQFTENGVGFSFSYERTLDKEGMISFYVPVITTFNLTNNGYNNNNNNNPNATMFYAMPGVKIYPTGMGKIRYALGASAVVGVGDKRVDDYYSSGYYQSVLKDHFLVGMMVNNSLNVNPSSHLYIGLELGLGFTYIDNVDGIRQGANPLVQGGFKVGYRF